MQAAKTPRLNEQALIRPGHRGAPLPAGGLTRGWGLPASFLLSPESLWNKTSHPRAATCLPTNGFLRSFPHPHNDSRCWSRDKSPGQEPLQTKTANKIPNPPYSHDRGQEGRRSSPP